MVEVGIVGLLDHHPNSPSPHQIIALPSSPLWNYSEASRVLVTKDFFTLYGINRPRNSIPCIIKTCNNGSYHSLCVGLNLRSR